MDESIIKWLDPWTPINTNTIYFEQELRKELGNAHVLFGEKVVAFGKREDCDDVLFVFYGSEYSLAVVHLTYGKNREENPSYPKTRLFKDINDWIENCMTQDHLEYTIAEE